MIDPLTEPADKRRRRTRTAVLDAAADLFARQGFRRTGVEELAQQADVALSSIYGNFPGGKADVYAALACRVADDHRDRMLEVLDGAPQPVELAVFDEYLRFHRDSPLAFRLLGLADVDGGDSDLVERARTQIRGVLTGLVEQATTASNLPAARARTELLRLWGTINGVLALRAQRLVGAGEADALLAEIRADLSARLSTESGA